MFDDELGQSMNHIAKKLGLSYGELVNAANKGALKLLYQNRDKLKLKELLEGGE